METPLLVLDLDETLIYSSQEAGSESSGVQVGPYFTRARPFLGEFLHDVSQVFSIGVWSSSSPDYVAAIVQRFLTPITEPEFSWARDKCTITFDHFNQAYVPEKRLKKLKKLGYNLQRVLIVDDSPEKVRRNYGNAIYVDPWFGEPRDQELRHLAEYLIRISAEPDFRNIEKRFWRKKA